MADRASLLPCQREPAIRTRQLQRIYRPAPSWKPSRETVQALRGVDFTVSPGEIHGLLGPNGAGKTTLCRILATVLLPTSGSALVLGFDVVSRAREVRERIGVVFGGDRGLYPRLTGRQNLHFFAALHGLSVADRRRLAVRLLDRVGLGDWADERVEQYSRGMRQRLHLARGLVGDPAILLLDEPTAGMDPAAAVEFRRLVDEFRREGRTVLLSTHNMVEAEQVCDRVSLIDHGALLATERPDTLTERVAGTERIEAEGVPPELVRRLVADGDVSLFEPAVGGGVRLEVPATATTVVLRQLLDAGVTRVRVSKPSLEEAYLALTRGSGLKVER